MRALTAVLLPGLLVVAAGCGGGPPSASPRDGRTSRERVRPAGTSRGEAESPRGDPEPASPPTAASPPLSEHDRAVAEVERLGGSVKRDGRGRDGRVVEVELGGSGVSDAHLACLKHFPQVRVLDLSFSKVTDAALPAVAGLKELEFLDLSGTRVTDAGLAHLAGLARLATLDLYRTRVSDAGLAHLKKFPALRLVVLRGTPVTAGGTQEVLREKPGLRIDR
jgi:hypothetical protein